MGETEEKLEKEIVDLRKQVKEMAIDVGTFSFAMRSLYVEKAVGTNEEHAVRFRKLRDDTRNDAMVYLKGILPLSTKFAVCITEYFEYYEALNYDEWCEMLSDILEETTGYRQLCETLVQMHEDILVSLKKRKDEAMTLLNECKDLKEEYERQKKELEESASIKQRLAVLVSSIPNVGAIAASLLTAVAGWNLSQAVAKGKQSQIQEAAAFTVGEVLIPALEHFIVGIKKAAGFFFVMENEIKTFEGRAEKAVNDRKRLHYKVMNREAKEMKSICQVFCAVLPDVKSDFLAIPTEGTDQNYVDLWLEKQKKAIQERCQVPSLARELQAAITQ